jgi:protein-tyrosine phosphatase
MEAIIEEVAPGILQATASGALLAYQARKERNIGGFVNVAEDIDQEYPGVDFLRLTLNDDRPVPPEIFDQAVQFQKKVSGRNQKTLVHCRMAVNRSSTILIAMMVAWGDTVDGAYGKLPRKPYTTAMLGSLREWARLRGYR